MGTSTEAQAPFVFPPHYSFPPFFTLQPTASTLASQLTSWSSLLQAYCRHNRLFVLNLTDALESPLFHNKSLRRRLSARDARKVIDYMASKEGGQCAEWISGSGGSSGNKSGSASGNGEEGGRCWVYWRRPEEWASLVEAWVEATGQKGVVFTVYEILEGQGTVREGESRCGLVSPNFFFLFAA
jgi:ESCRT-II complex subunit VPS25